MSAIWCVGGAGARPNECAKIAAGHSGKEPTLRIENAILIDKAPNRMETRPVWTRIGHDISHVAGVHVITTMYTIVHVVHNTPNAAAHQYTMEFNLDGYRSHMKTISLPYSGLCLLPHFCPLRSRSPKVWVFIAMSDLCAIRPNGPKSFFRICSSIDCWISDAIGPISTPGRLTTGQRLNNEHAQHSRWDSCMETPSSFRSLQA